MIFISKAVRGGAVFSVGFFRLLRRSPLSVVHDARECRFRSSASSQTRLSVTGHFHSGNPVIGILISMFRYPFLKFRHRCYAMGDNGFIVFHTVIVFTLLCLKFQS